jgi:uncharacterized Zn finger protein
MRCSAMATMLSRGTRRWLRPLMRSMPTCGCDWRSPERVEQPADALAVYERVADEVLVETDRRAYTRAVRILKRARSVADAAGNRDDFTAYISRLREQHRRRPSLIAMLDKAKLD